MKKFLSFTFAVFIIFASVLHAGNQDKLFRYPSISPDGKTIAFSFQGDIWTVPAKGGEAVRRTVHEAYEGISLWNYDGSKLAFMSNRFGNNDIFTMPASGGIPKRLTYHSANDELTDWTKKGDLLFTTARDFKQVEWDNEIYSVNENGGTPSRLLNAVGHTPTMSPNGRFIAFVRGACRITREAYRGPANKNIWIYDTKEDKYIQITTDEGQDI
ncbi:MAG: peptidase S41, partial [Ignavibacteria bacterium]